MIQIGHTIAPSYVFNINAMLKSFLIAISLSPLISGAQEVEPFPPDYAMSLEQVQKCLQYPALSKLMQEEGKVLVRARIQVEGDATDIRISQSSGFQRLDVAAVAFVRCAKFKPGVINGEPKTLDFNIPVRFRLDDSRPKPAGKPVT